LHPKSKFIHPARRRLNQSVPLDKSLPAVPAVATHRASGDPRHGTDRHEVRRHRELAFEIATAATRSARSNVSVAADERAVRVSWSWT
jgi:hypothetical protein